MIDRCLIAIPAFNEQRELPKVLRAVWTRAEHVLVIDDGSSDGTPEILRQWPDAHVIRHERNFGYGRSLADAFAFGVDNGFEWVITMDCDGQHEPRYLEEFVREIEKDDADIISGSRYLKPLAGNDLPPAERRAINHEVTEILNDRLGLSLTDAFCGFKAYRSSSLARLRITEDGYAMPLQLWVQAVLLGLRVRELPISLVYNDLNRSFGGDLDDPQARLDHYLSVFEAELEDPAICTDPCGRGSSVPASCS